MPVSCLATSSLFLVSCLLYNSLLVEMLSVPPMKVTSAIIKAEALRSLRLYGPLQEYIYSRCGPECDTFIWPYLAYVCVVYVFPLFGGLAAFVTLMLQDDLMDFIGSGKLTQLEDQVEGSVLDGSFLGVLGLWAFSNGLRLKPFR